jgi:hypothetical protein
MNNPTLQAPQRTSDENVGQATEIRFAEVPDSDGIEVSCEHEHESGPVTILLIDRKNST